MFNTKYLLFLLAFGVLTTDANAKTCFLNGADGCSEKNLDIDYDDIDYCKQAGYTKDCKVRTVKHAYCDEDHTYYECRECEAGAMTAHGYETAVKYKDSLTPIAYFLEPITSEPTAGSWSLRYVDKIDCKAVRSDAKKDECGDTYYGYAEPDCSNYPVNASVESCRQKSHVLNCEACPGCSERSRVTVCENGWYVSGGTKCIQDSCPSSQQSSYTTREACENSYNNDGNISWASYIRDSGLTCYSCTCSSSTCSGSGSCPSHATCSSCAGCGSSLYTVTDCDSGYRKSGNSCVSCNCSSSYQYTSSNCPGTLRGSSCTNCDGVTKWSDCGGSREETTEVSCSIGGKKDSSTCPNGCQSGTDCKSGSITYCTCK